MMTHFGIAWVRVCAPHSVVFGFSKHDLEIEYARFQTSWILSIPASRVIPKILT